MYEDVAYFCCDERYLGCLCTLSESGVSWRRVADLLICFGMICLFCCVDTIFVQYWTKDERSTKLTAHAIHMRH